MLDFQLKQTPFRYGLAEGDDPHAVPFGVLTTCENYVWKKSNRVEKRSGIDPIGPSILGGGSIAAASRLFARGTELCLVDGARLFTYSSVTDSWKNIGKVPDVGVTSTTLVDTMGGVACAESAISSDGIRVDAWVTGDGTTTGAALFFQVVDTATGGLLRAPVAAYFPAQNCSGIRVLIMGPIAAILTLTGAANISAVTVNLATLTFSAVTNLRTDSIAIDGDQGWDACVIGSNFVIAYTATGPLLKLYSYNTSLVQQATGGITSETLGAMSVSIDGASGEALYVLYVQGQTAGPRNLVKIAIADATTLVQTVAPVTVETPSVGFPASQVAVCRYDATSCIAAYRQSETFGYRVTSYKISSTATFSVVTQRGTYGTAMVTRPFMLNGACYMGLVLQSAAAASAPADRSTVLVEVETTDRTGAYTPHRYVGCIDVLIGGGILQENGNPMPNVAALSSTSVVAAIPFTSTENYLVRRQGLRLANFTIGTSRPADMWRSRTISRETMLAAGVLTSYDGRTAFDYGFPRAPGFYSVTPSNGAGAMALGTYLYGDLLEYRSATGLLYRSPTQTAGGTVTLTGAEDTVTIQTNDYNLGNKQTTATLFGAGAALPTIHPWYRTVVGGTVYQRLTVEPAYNVTTIDMMTSSAQFIDLHADSNVGSGEALAERPALYTSGGTLDDYAPPGCVTMAYHADRLWTLAGDQKTWWYSKTFQDDFGVAPGFNPAFRVAFADTQTAMASMDDKAIFFSPTGVKYMLGQGPAKDGTGSDLSSCIPIQTDVGCTNPRSIVSMPDGIMFQSARGIYILTRGLELEWIGRPVQDTLLAYPNITSAVLVANRNEIRFTANDADAELGVVIVFNYVEKQWSTFKYLDATRAGIDSAGTETYGCPIADACVWDGHYTFATPAGAVYRESDTHCLDGTTYVPGTLETAWNSAAGPLAYHAVRNFWVQGFSNTDHDLTIEAAFDSSSTYEQARAFPSLSRVTNIGDIEETKISIGKRRKCSSIRFRITDTAPSTAGSAILDPAVDGSGKGPTFQSMGYEVGLKQGDATAKGKKG